MMPTRSTRECVIAAVAAVSLIVTIAGAPAAAEQIAGDSDLTSLSGTYLAARTADVEKDVPGAAAYYREALKSDPDNAYFLERALILTCASGDVGEAIGFARQLYAKSPPSHPARLVLAV